MHPHQCLQCKESIDDVYYNCDECDGKFLLCANCFLSTSEGPSKHEHKLSRVELDVLGQLLFSYQDTKSESKNTLYLSDIPVAIPGNSILKDKKIKSVLSLLQAETLKDKFSLSSLYTESTPNHLYHDELDSIVYLKQHDMTYYNISIPDVMNPASIAKIDLNNFHAFYAFDVFAFFCRVVAYIEERLKVGNVLVHCEKGRRRSPTAFLAWLLTKGYRTRQAINLIGDGYTGEDDWSSGYCKVRSLWMARLDEWATHSPTLLQKFAQHETGLFDAYRGTKLTQSKIEGIKSSIGSKNRKNINWESPYDEKELDPNNPKKRAISPSPSSNSKLESKQQKIDSSSKNGPPLKKFKVVETKMMPSLWAKKR